MATPRDLEVQRIKKDWTESPRWKGVKRGYTAEDVYRLRGSVQVEHTLARRGSEKLWKMMHERPFVNSLGALTGNQAMQQVKAGVPAIYLSGWQVAADGNLAASVYPDQSLYPSNSVPAMVNRQTMTGTGQLPKFEVDLFRTGLADRPRRVEGPRFSGALLGRLTGRFASEI